MARGRSSAYRIQRWTAADRQGGDRNPGARRTRVAALGTAATRLGNVPVRVSRGDDGSVARSILGDVDKNAAENWAWGRTQPDVALLVYGATQPDVDVLAKMLINEATTLGMTPPYEIPLKEVSESKEEPFGFRRRISARTGHPRHHKGLRNAHPIHLVEPGEFILGYPDNRGNTPPGPTLPASPIRPTSFRSSARSAVSTRRSWKTTAT